MSTFQANIAAEVRRLAKKTAGAVFWLKKQITSSNITTAGVDLTGVSTGGDLAIEDVVLKVGTTGLWVGSGNPSTIRLISNNTNGTQVVLATLSSLLTTSRSLDLLAARDHMENLTLAAGGTGRGDANMSHILEEGKKLSLSSSLTMTGSGTVDVWMKFRKIEDDSDVKAA